MSWMTTQWNVRKNGKWLETLNGTATITADSIRQSLIRAGYPLDITVTRVGSLSDIQVMAVCADHNEGR